MPILLNALERLVMVKMNRGPAPLLDILGGFAFYAVHAAIRLNVFEELGSNSLTVSELAEKCDGSKRGMAALMDVLELLGYIRKRRQKYENSPMTSKWLLSGSPTSLMSGFNYYFATMHELWPHLHESIKKGGAHIPFYGWISGYPDIASSYQEFMMKLAKMTVPELLKKIQLRENHRNLIDIGGGHGLYSIGLCRKYKDISVTIFDSSYARIIAEHNAVSARLDDRIQFKEGDYLHDEIGFGYDAALVFNVVHEHTAEDNMKLIHRIADSLADKGTIFIMDILREKKMRKTADLIARMYSLIFYHFLGGQNYSFEEISDWLKSSGFREVKRINLFQSGLSLVVGHTR